MHWAHTATPHIICVLAVFNARETWALHHNHRKFQVFCTRACIIFIRESLYIRTNCVRSTTDFIFHFFFLGNYAAYLHNANALHVSFKYTHTHIQIWHIYIFIFLPVIFNTYLYLYISGHVHLINGKISARAQR